MQEKDYLTRKTVQKDFSFRKVCQEKKVIVNFIENNPFSKEGTVVKSH